MLPLAVASETRRLALLLLIEVWTTVAIAYRAARQDDLLQKMDTRSSRNADSSAHLTLAACHLPDLSPKVKPFSTAKHLSDCHFIPSLI